MVKFNILRTFVAFESFGLHIIVRLGHLEGFLIPKCPKTATFEKVRKKKIQSVRLIETVRQLSHEPLQQFEFPANIFHLRQGYY